MLYLTFLWMAIVVLGGVLALYYVFVPGAHEARFGVPEELPSDLGVWHTDSSSAEAAAALAEGLDRETRLLATEARGLGPPQLIRQIRYRDRLTGRITRVDPEERLCTRRQRPS